MKNTLTAPLKVDQVAALFQLVFEQNPDTVMTRRQIEECVSVTGFSKSTRERALNDLAYRGVVRYQSDWPGGRPSTYWMPGK